MIRPVAERERHRANRRRIQIRRRRAAVVAAAAVALIAGVAVGAGGGGDEAASPPAGEEGRTVPEESAEKAVDRLSLEQQVGRMVILRFAGTEAPRYVLDVLGEGRAAGAILFRDNVVDPDQLRRLTRSLRRAAPGVLVCVDQEGGAIRIVPWAPPERAAPEQQAFGAVREDSEAAGRELRAAGINVTLGPVADVPNVEGSVTIDRTRRQLDEDLAPFAHAIEAGTEFIMASHAVYPALDDERIASQSPAVVEDLLRDELGFGGVVMTDSLEAQAVQD